MFSDITAWEQERLGKFTSSEIYKLMKSGKGKDKYFADTATTYIKSKLAELITGERTPDVSSNAIEYGRSMEPEAFEVFKRLRPELNPVHFGISVPKFFPFGDFAGGSPDGQTSDNGIIEIKCPYNSTNHIEHLLLETQEDFKEYTPAYYWQVQANILFTGTDKAYFISYDPRVVEFTHRIKVLLITRDITDQIEIENRIFKAAELLSDYLNKLSLIKTNI